MRALIIASISILSIFGHRGNIEAQCPAAFDCWASDVLCSINALNGFTCNNPITPNAGFPLPSLCFGAGIPHNLGWWAFIANGEVLSLTFNFDISGCESGQGIQAGVFQGSCDGSSVWDCNDACNRSTFTLYGATRPCEIYYVWVDGCNGDVCTYTMSVNGVGGPPSLPPLPPLTAYGRVYPCGTFKVCAPDLPGGCEPTTQWTIDGKLQNSRDECIRVNVPESAKPGDSITVCMIATIGNPDVPGGICDQDMVCTEFVIEPILKDTIPCESICFENAPYQWHGLTISSSCISPPCSTRITDPSGCFVDIYQSLIFQSKPGHGKKDTLICQEGIPFVAENGSVYVKEVCNDTIFFKRRVVDTICPSAPVLCDTSYELSIYRFNYSIDWKFSCDSCGNSLQLFPNVAYTTKCEEFKDSIRVDIEWVNAVTGDILDTMRGDSFITINIPGQYCLNPIGYYKEMALCKTLTPECITITKAMIDQDHNIDGPTMTCSDSSHTFSISKSTNICEINWRIKGQGQFLGKSDSSLIQVLWDSLALDTTQICANIKTNCSEYELCKVVLICPKTTSLDDYEQGEMYYSFPTHQIIWRNLITDKSKNTLTIHNFQGQIVMQKKISANGLLDIQNLPKGIYLASITSSNKRTKIVKKIIR